MTVKSKLEITPGNFIEVETEIPIWLIVILTSAAVLIVKEITQ